MSLYCFCSDCLNPSRCENNGILTAAHLMKSKNQVIKTCTYSKFFQAAQKCHPYTRGLIQTFIFYMWVGRHSGVSPMSLRSHTLLVLCGPSCLQFIYSTITELRIRKLCRVVYSTAGAGDEPVGPGKTRNRKLKKQGMPRISHGLTRGE